MGVVRRECRDTGEERATERERDINKAREESRMGKGDWDTSVPSRPALGRKPAEPRQGYPCRSLDG